MINIISYIEKILAKEIKGRDRPVANNLVKISTDGPRVIISAGDGNHHDREYNKANLWVAFNRYDLEAGQSDKISREYSFKIYNRGNFEVPNNS